MTSLFPKLCHLKDFRSNLLVSLFWAKDVAAFEFLPAVLSG